MLSNIGGFGGLFELNSEDYERPVLRNRWCGDKGQIGTTTGILEGVGVDLVAMCVNDIITSVQNHCSFLIILQPQNSITHNKRIIRGIADGCLQSEGTHRWRNC